ncbi:ABC transporter substrate-binding protein [Zavarzinia compransoris]|uniref:heme/hemin ABC transporter substrate-binding protein n=1 Tax=Zavarzinia marina TaxID=2911065 RepID=UPI001F39D8D5|nr:ABC transporter substrate-binding protein [Zavarzinia marina]MCF4165859.1 ABC transporter substrate-binding protein [Zavarzinia marina]
MPRRLLAAALILSALAAPAMAEPGRIVSLDGSATEILYRLGKETDLVATDLTSTYPPAVFALPKVGYVRALTAEGVIAFSPDLIIAPPDAGPANAIAQIESAGIPIRTLPDDPRPDGIAEKIRAVAALVDAEAAGDALAAEVTAAFAETFATVGRATSRPRVLFLLDLGKGAPLAGGDRTSADAMIAMAGGINAVSGVTGFRPVSTEAIVAAAPDYIVLMDHVAERLGGPAAIAALAPLDQTPAGRNGDIVVMDGLFLLGFGPRTPAAVLELARHIHPELAAP